MANISQKEKKILGWQCRVGNVTEEKGREVRDMPVTQGEGGRPSHRSLQCSHLECWAFLRTLFRG